MIGVFPCASDLIGTWIYDSLEQNRTKNKKLTQLADIIAPPYNRERIQKSSWREVAPSLFTTKRESKVYLAKKQ